MRFSIFLLLLAALTGCRDNSPCTLELGRRRRGVSPPGHRPLAIEDHAGPSATSGTATTQLAHARRGVIIRAARFQAKRRIAHVYGVPRLGRG